MMVRVRSSVVTCRMVRVRQLDREPAPDEGLEALVDRRKRDGRKLSPNGKEYLVSGRVRVRGDEEAEDRRPLIRVPLTVHFERSAEKLFAVRMIHGVHRILSDRQSERYTTP